MDQESMAPASAPIPPTPPAHLTNNGHKQLTISILIGIFVILALLGGSFYVLKNLQQEVQEDTHQVAIENIDETPPERSTITLKEPFAETSDETVPAENDMPSAENQKPPATETESPTTPPSSEVEASADLSEDEARALALTALNGLPDFISSQGKNGAYLTTTGAPCEGCFDLVYLFDAIKDGKPVKGEVTLKVRNGAVESGARATFSEKTAYEAMVGLLTSLDSDAGIPVSMIRDKTFAWSVPDHKGSRQVVLTGKSVKSNGVRILPEQASAFFRTKGFLQDWRNTGSEGSSKITGYTKGSLVCLVNDALSGGGTHDLEVSCATK
jgi:hypothetical protein